jgi:hypothetical protein
MARRKHRKAVTDLGEDVGHETHIPLPVAGDFDFTPPPPIPHDLVPSYHPGEVVEPVAGVDGLLPDTGLEGKIPDAEVVVGSKFTQLDQQTLIRTLAEIATRRCESLRIYESLPIIERFHKDARRERLLRGSNRAGKTLAAAVEMARAVTGQDPHGKFPKKNGRAAIVGLDDRHNGQVLYRKLFRADAFKIIKDESSGQWRAFSPRRDAARKAQAKPAPPLIPKRWVETFAWKEKKSSIPSTITLKNGWELYFFSSKGSPPNGIDIDLLWIDEEIENEAWWPEMVARLLDRKGSAFWSATPQVASEHLWNLHVRAEEDPESVGEHVALLQDNPHIDAEEKLLFEKRLVTDEERRVRVKGEFAMTGYKVYPNFSMSIHGFDLDGPVPRDWARFIAVDPGRQVCAVLFAAVPPPHHNNPCILLYDELYLKASDAEIFGKAVRGKIDGVLPELFFIDSHAGRVHEMGSGLTVESQYLAALVRNGVTTGRGTPSFVWGADDPKAGVLACHEAMRIQPNGKPVLQVCRGRLPHFEYEVTRYHNRRVNKIVTDEPEKKNDHLMDCLRYIVTASPQWVKPKYATNGVNYAVAAVRAKLAKKRKKEGQGGSGGVRLGPGRK